MTDDCMCDSACSIGTVNSTHAVAWQFHSMCIASSCNIPFPPHMPTCIWILCGRASCLILPSIDCSLPVIAFVQQLRVLSAGCTAYGQVGTATALCHSIDRSQTLVSHSGHKPYITGGCVPHAFPVYGFISCVALYMMLHTLYTIHYIIYLYNQLCCTHAHALYHPTPIIYAGYPKSVHCYHRASTHLHTPRQPATT